VGIAAAETKSPRRNIAKSCHRVFYKILTLYMLSILTIGWTVPSYDPRLLSETGNAGQSPFVIAMEIAGIKGLPHFANALFFSSAFSAGNAYLYSASRILYGACHIETIQFGLSNAFQGLSLRGQAPLIFTRCTTNGLPIVSVIFCVGRFDSTCRTFVTRSFQSFFSLLAYMSLRETSGVVFHWFVNLTTIGGFFAWFAINTSYLAFCASFLILS
jgi:amino acid transporter